MFVILHISDSDKHFSSAIQEYEKRLGKQLHLDPLKPFKDSNKELVIHKETEEILQTLKKKYAHFQKILMIKEGTQRTTEELHQKIIHQDTVFIIGWPYGVDEKSLKAWFPDLKELSFGRITLPHGLAKLVLIEQLYRCTTIEQGKSYHY